MKKILISGILSGLLFTNMMAKEVSVSETAKLMGIAEKQRMLSQRMVKDYLYAGKGIAKSKANKELKETIETFDKNTKYILNVTNDDNINNLLAFVNMSFNDFKEYSKEDFSIDNAKLVLDLSEALLEGSEFLVSDLKKKYSTESNKIISLSGRQGMLAQRIAKYYISYQSGVKDSNSIDQVKKAVLEFTKGQETLMNYKGNTPEINKKLKEVQKLWNIVYKFYNNIEEGGLPFIVYTSTDKITKIMDDLTNQYIALEGKKGE